MNLVKEGGGKWKMRAGSLHSWERMMWRYMIRRSNTEGKKRKRKKRLI